MTNTAAGGGYFLWKKERELGVCKIFIRTAGGLGAVSKMPFDGQDISVVKKGGSSDKVFVSSYFSSGRQ